MAHHPQAESGAHLQQAEGGVCRFLSRALSGLFKFTARCDEMNEDFLSRQGVHAIARLEWRGVQTIDLETLTIYQLSSRKITAQNDLYP